MVETLGVAVAEEKLEVVVAADTVGVPDQRHLLVEVETVGVAEMVGVETVEVAEQRHLLVVVEEEMMGEENDEVGGVREEEDMEDGFCEGEEGG